LAVSDLSIAQDLRDNRIQVGGPRSRAANTQDDPIALGRPLSYWLKSIRTRDPINVEMAFEAIVQLGPAARAAIPDLTQIVAEPFIPIRIGKDSREEIHGKLLNIELRAGAVDGLGAIGEAAAPSAAPVIQWGLTMRVITPTERYRSTDAFLIELIGIDVLERMRAAGTVAQFGLDASGPVQNLIESGDNEKRKFAAAILNEQTVFVAARLMQRDDCLARMRGLSLLSAMWPVVASEHLVTLNEILECSEDDNNKPLPVVGPGAEMSSNRRQ
jgi:hypothetical protein